MVFKIVLQEQLAAFKSHLVRLRWYCCVYVSFDKGVSPAPIAVSGILHCLQEEQSQSQSLTKIPR